MATVNYTSQGNLLDHAIYSWTPLTTTNADGQPIGYAGSGQRTVEVNGTFGVGGTCVIEGTLDSVNWYQLTDLGGAALSFTAAGLKGIREDTIAVRPRVTAGDVTTALTCNMSVRRQFRM